MASVAYFTDPLFLEHDTGMMHPESAKRLESVQNRLEKASYYSQLKSLPRRFAEIEELMLNHGKSHIEKIEQASITGRLIDADTVTSEKSYEAARLAAGAGLAAVDAVTDGTVQRAVLAVRPPGHHSIPDRAMGFCLFNNIAIAAKYAKTKGYGRIAILDWDVHHGNGTQDSFYEDPDVLFISTHQYPFYPGSGGAEETGAGAGKGTTLNCPMPAGAEMDLYIDAFENQILPTIEDFRPDLILVSAGFDAHKADPLASVRLDTESYEWMTRKVLKAANEHCGGKVISFLEGGYDLDALAESVEVHTAAMLQN